jgi:integrase
MSVRRRTWRTKRGESRESWIVNYTDQDGARRIETFDRRRDAEARYAEIQINLRTGTHTAVHVSPTVGEAAQDWLTAVELRGRERATLKGYHEHVELHINPALGNLKLATLTAPRVVAFAEALQRRKSRLLARKVLTSLKSLLRDAQRRGIVAQNVAAAVSIAPDQRRELLTTGINIPTPDEIRRILAAASPRWRPMLVTAVFTGLRASELRGLRWGDVDLKHAELHVRQRADRYGTIGQPKSRAGSRVIPIGPMVVNTLRQWKLTRRPGELVFGTRTGRPTHHTTLVCNAFLPAQIVAGVTTMDGKAKYTGLHALRHFYASWCINRKADGGLELPLKVVQARLGHASIQMTADRYGHLFPRGDDGAELADAEHALLGPISRRS